MTNSMHALRLEHMTIFDVDPVDVVAIAEEFGIPKISLWTTRAMDGARPVTAAEKTAVLNRLRNSQVDLDTVEVFVLGHKQEEWESGVALAAELGAKAVVVVNAFISDEEAAAAQLADFSALAQRYGLIASLEPIYMGTTRSLADGLRLLRKAPAPNLRLTLDLLHMFRTNTPLADIAALDPALISSAQLCDGPPAVNEDDYTDEGGYSRMLPGTGCFPIEQFLRVIPLHIPMGMEVPLRPLRENGVCARDRTRLVVESTRALQQAVSAQP
jgi:sugar phosphate isomerase/epimerase